MDLHLILNPPVKDDLHLILNSPIKEKPQPVTSKCVYRAPIRTPTDECAVHRPIPSPMNVNINSPTQIQDYGGTNSEVASVITSGSISSHQMQSNSSTSPETGSSSPIKSYSLIPPGPTKSTPTNFNKPLARSLPRRASRSSHRRLRPNEHANFNGGRQVPWQERFCWNIGHWLSSRVGGDKTNFKVLESLAGTLLHNVPATLLQLAPNEVEYLHKVNGIPIAIYRSLRVRIMIGMALIYEHNLRCRQLIIKRKCHVACRPVETVSHNFNFINMGRSQAQMVCIGFDVNRVSEVFEQAVAAEYIPAACDIPRRKKNEVFQPFDAADEAFPELERWTLYNDLQRWYTEEQIPPEMQFVVSNDYIK